MEKVSATELQEMIDLVKKQGLIENFLNSEDKNPIKPSSRYQNKLLNPNELSPLGKFLLGKLSIKEAKESIQKELSSTV
jgi:hypothetical protein